MSIGCASGGCSGEKSGLSPDRRLLWDSFDTTMRERVEGMPLKGESVGRAVRVLSGRTSGAGTRAEAITALASLGYTDSGRDRWISSDALSDARASTSDSDSDSPPCPSPAGGTTLGCWPYDPSTSRSKCGTDCIDEMYADPYDLCDEFLNCDAAVRTVSPSKLREMSEGVKHERDPRIWGTVEEETALILAAWSLIVENIDLVKWAVCKATGETSPSIIAGTAARAALLARIYGLPTKITVHVVDVDGHFMSVFGTSIIWVSRKGEFTRSMELWANGAHEERLCAALDLAATLFHELTHIAGFSYADLDDSECYYSYMIESAFRWAIANRYPDSACCSNLACSFIYGCGSPKYANWSSCLAYNSGWDPDKSGWETFVGYVQMAADFLRGVIGATVGFVLNIPEWVVTGLGIALEWAAEGIAEAAEAVVEAVQKVIGWLESFFEGTGGGSGSGCCDCSCEFCYQFCPGLWRQSPCSCVPSDTLDAGMASCLVECAEARTAEGAELSEDSTTVPADGW